MSRPSPKSDTTSKQASSGWHLALEAATKGTKAGNYLGDPDTVEGLVRAFMAGITDRYDSVSSGGMTHAEATEAAKAEVERMGAIFAGKKPTEYVSMGAWNTDGGLASWIRQTMPGKVNADDDALAIRDVFAGLLLTIWEGLADLQAGETTAEGLADYLDGLADDWTALLLGLPPEADDGDTEANPAPPAPEEDTE